MAGFLYCESNSNVFLTGQSSNISPTYFVYSVAKHHSISPLDTFKSDEVILGKVLKQPPAIPNHMFMQF
jgi:hypothetical protein